MQTGHMGSSVDPTGGVVATSEEGVYCTAAINRTWQTSPSEDENLQPLRSR